MQPAGRIAPIPPWMERAETRTLLAALAREGALARFVGGCVRDAVLGRPGQDIDIAIDRPPDEIMRLLAAGGIRALPTGLAHGTVTARIGVDHFEITSLRRDVETFGRHARVAFTDDWQADAARRDFTINALFADPDGTLYDPIGGLADLAAGRVRFVGEPGLRIAEDALRLLRFFRFHAYYGRGEPDGAAVDACAAAAAALDGLSGERLWGELKRLLLAPAPNRVLATMAACSVLAHLLPAPADIARLARLCPIEAAVAAPDALRRLAALLPLISKPAAAAALRLALAARLALAVRLALARAEARRLSGLVRPLPGLDAAPSAPALHRLLYREGRERVRDHLLLDWAGDPASSPTDETRLRLVGQVEDWAPPLLPVRGEDILALGVAAGPEVGRLLARIEAWWEAGDFRAGRPAALAELRRLAGR